MKTKQCTKCRKVKPLSAFYKKSVTKDGYDSRCKVCHKKYEREYYEEHKEEQRESNQKQREENREKNRIYAREYRIENPGKVHDTYLRRKYGITRKEYKTMLRLQGGGCAICGKTPEENIKRLSVDHDHDTGEIRGLLCNNCNRILGYLNDNPELCEALKLYLQKHGKGGKDVTKQNIL